MKTDKINPVWMLLTGTALMTGSHLNFNIESLAWIGSAPFLLYLSMTEGWKSRLWFFLALLLSWSLCVLKIMTDPIPLFMVPAYSLPIALFQLPGYLLWARYREQRFAWLLFPAVMVAMEWVQYTFTPLGSWGAAAYTQADSILLLQSISLFGMGGLGFLIYLVNGLLAEQMIQGRFRLRKLVPTGLLLAGFLVYGSVRYDLYRAGAREQIKVAAVGTDSEAGGLPLPSDETRFRNQVKLIQRTEQAADAGAELIVWNEAAAVILPGEEDEWNKRLSALAGEKGITLVASYVVPRSESPFQYDNKYILYKPDGTPAYRYHKHEPVPGEPARKGEEPIENVLVNGVRIGGAICYDYDFPYLARSFGRIGTDIMAVPSSDWRGIDPLHTRMAAFRAIEQGHSIVRSTRFGLSAAINPAGEMVGQMSSFNGNDRIMIALLPVQGSFTLYGVTGDLLVYLCIAFAAFFLIRALWPELHRKREWQVLERG